MFIYVYIIKAFYSFLKLLNHSQKKVLCPKPISANFDTTPLGTTASKESTTLWFQT